MKTLDAEKLEAALTDRIGIWNGKIRTPYDSYELAAAVLMDVRQCVREAAGIDKGINED